MVGLRNLPSLVVGAVLDGVVVVAGIALTFIGDLGTAPLAASLALVGIITFTGLYVYMSGRVALTDDARMRRAIAGTFVIVYLVILPMFLNEQVRKALETGVANTVLIGFTTLVGTIVAFYFGSSAAVDRARVVAGTVSNEDEGTEIPPLPSST